MLASLKQGAGQVSQPGIGAAISWAQGQRLKMSSELLSDRHVRGELLPSRACGTHQKSLELQGRGQGGGQAATSGSGPVNWSLPGPDGSQDPRGRSTAPSWPTGDRKQCTDPPTCTATQTAVFPACTPPPAWIVVRGPVSTCRAFTVWDHSPVSHTSFLSPSWLPLSCV